MGDRPAAFANIVFVIMMHLFRLACAAHIAVRGYMTAIDQKR